MSRYLVTGGAGFIGSHLVDHFVGLGQDVRVIDDFSSGKMENIAKNLSSIELVQGSVEDIETVRRAMEGVDFVFHHAALVSVPMSVEQPLKANSVNVTGTLNVLLAARDAGVKRVVFASSSAVYGNDPAIPKLETMPPSPPSPYAVNKLTGEYYCKMFTELYGLETVCLRYFNVFGPRQDPTSQYSAVIPKFLDAIRGGGSVTIHGDGMQSRDFTYVTDIVAANDRACHTPMVSGQVINIACGESYSLLQLVDTLSRLLDKPVTPIFGPPRPGDVKHSVADISKARECLGYSPGTEFGEGLRKLVASE